MKKINPLSLLLLTVSAYLIWGSFIERSAIPVILAGVLIFLSIALRK